MIGMVDWARVRVTTTIEEDSASEFLELGDKVEITHAVTKSTGKLFAERHRSSFAAVVSMPRRALCFGVLEHGC